MYHCGRSAENRNSSPLGGKEESFGSVPSFPIFHSRNFLLRNDRFCFHEKEAFGLRS